LISQKTQQNPKKIENAKKPEFVKKSENSEKTQKIIRKPMFFIKKPDFT
jgi:hypothetical protein